MVQAGLNVLLLMVDTIMMHIGQLLTSLIQYSLILIKQLVSLKTDKAKVQFIQEYIGMEKNLILLELLVFSTTAPVGASSGDFYYHLDKKSKTCVLKKYNGSTWIDATEKDTLKYEYYRINSKGVELDTSCPI